MPTFGSIVQNGKLAASALALESELKSVLLPTLGRPTMPQEKPIVGGLLPPAAPSAIGKTAAQRGRSPCSTNRRKTAAPVAVGAMLARSAAGSRPSSASS